MIDCGNYFHKFNYFISRIKLSYESDLARKVGYPSCPNEKNLREERSSRTPLRFFASFPSSALQPLPPPAHGRSIPATLRMSLFERTLLARSTRQAGSNNRYGSPSPDGDENSRSEQIPCHVPPEKNSGTYFLPRTPSAFGRLPYGFRHAGGCPKWRCCLNHLLRGRFPFPKASGTAPEPRTAARYSPAFYLCDPLSKRPTA